LKDAWASGDVRKTIGAAVSTNDRRMSDAPSVNGARTATGGRVLIVEPCRNRIPRPRTSISASRNAVSGRPEALLLGFPGRVFRGLHTRALESSLDERSRLRRPHLQISPSKLRVYPSSALYKWIRLRLGRGTHRVCCSAVPHLHGHTSESGL
jgi:hypothetical protein